MKRSNFDTMTEEGWRPTTPPESEKIYQGKVDFFNDTGGYGFINSPSLDNDVFYHMEDVSGRDIHDGTDLSFVWKETEDGPRATHIRVIDTEKLEIDRGSVSQNATQMELSSPAASISPTDKRSVRKFLSKYDKLTHLHHVVSPPDEGPIQTPLRIFTLEGYKPATRDKPQNSFSRNLVNFAKCNDDTHFEYFLSRIRDLLYRRFILDDAEYDYITVFPSHEAESLNPQLTALAREATIETSLLYSPLLERTETADKQRSKSHDERMDVARNPGKTVQARNELSNDVVVLLDDVCTSGASLLEGAYLLRNAGARKVVGLCLGLTNGGDANTITIEDRQRRASEMIDTNV